MAQGGVGLGSHGLTNYAPTTVGSGSSSNRQWLHSFHSAYCEDIENFIAKVPAARDLLHAFPGLLFALSTGAGRPRQRNKAIRLLASGAPLKDIADAIDLPWWMRRLPADAFVEPIVTFPADPDFHRRIATLVPTDPNCSATWLRGVCIGLKACHPSFALWAAGWLARQHRTVGLPEVEEQFWLLAAWAWHADKPKSTGHRLLRRMWTPQISLRRAMDELASWRQRMTLATLLGAEAGDQWLNPGVALEYEFIPLISADDFVTESERMGNCLDQYADRFARNFSRIFAVRKNGRSVANVEIGLDDQDGRMPAILQLRGPRNRRTSAELWRAAYLWLGSQPLKPRTAISTRLDPEKLEIAAQNIWAPYIKDLEKSGCEDAFRLSLSTARLKGERLAKKPTRRNGQVRAGQNRTTKEPALTSARRTKSAAASSSPSAQCTMITS